MENANALKIWLTSKGPISPGGNEGALAAGNQMEPSSNDSP